MKIYYKEREIDYEKTLSSLEVRQYIVVPTSDRDIANIRAQVSKVSKKLPNMEFTVNKTINGARICRIV